MPVTLLREAGPITVDEAKEVQQDELLVKFYSAEDNAGTLLYSSGLNPCLGIALHGEVEFNGPESPTKTYFVAMNHNSGLPQNLISDIANQKKSVKKVISSFCKEVVVNLIVAIENQSEAEVNSIILKQSFLVRCEQTDKTNLQEKVAAKIEEILSDKNKILRALENDESLEAEFLVADDYAFAKVAEKEKKVGEESDAMHFILHANEFKSPLKIYHKGFLSLLDVLQGKPSPVNSVSIAMTGVLQAHVSPQHPVLSSQSSGRVKIIPKNLNAEFMDLPLDDQTPTPIAIPADSRFFNKKRAGDGLTKEQCQAIDEAELRRVQPGLTANKLL